MLIFNKNSGDTLSLEFGWATLNEPYRMVIDSVFNISIDGIILKKYQVRGIDNFRYTPSGQPEFIVDKIGSLDYFCTQNSFSLGSNYDPLRCFEDSILDTNFTNLPCDYQNIYSVNENSINSKISLFPNPAQDYINIESAELEILNYEVLNVQGKVITVEYNPNSQLNVNQFKKGVYLLKIHTTIGTVVKKWIKE